MSFDLPALPYPYYALEPHISRRTMELHHQKHHGGYVTKLNDLIEGTPYSRMSLEEIIRRSAGKSGQQAVFNNAAQAWNHTFFWQTMSPRANGGKPVGNFSSRLNETFGSFQDFCRTFVDAAVNQFGSGWAWLVLDHGRLMVTSTPNAVNPLAEGKTPLMTCDVWEHAYYLDYQSRRKDFVETFLEYLVNWDHVAARLELAPQVEEVH